MRSPVDFVPRVRHQEIAGGIRGNGRLSREVVAIASRDRARGRNHARVEIHVLPHRALVVHLRTKIFCTPSVCPWFVCFPFVFAPASPAWAKYTLPSGA